MKVIPNTNFCTAGVTRLVKFSTTIRSQQIQFSLHLKSCIKTTFHRQNSPLHFQRAFSLVELIVVMGIMTALAAISMPALSGLSKGSGITAGGNQLVDMANFARQNAITQNAITALVIVVGSGKTTLDYKAYCIMEYKPGANHWTPVSKWQFLPTGVEIQKNTSFLETSPTVTPSIGSVQCQNYSLAPEAYAYQTFLPDGSMDTGASSSANTPPVLKVISDKNSTSDYYQVTFNQFTGSVKVQRP